MMCVCLGRLQLKVVMLITFTNSVQTMCSYVHWNPLDFAIKNMYELEKTNNKIMVIATLMLQS